ncbi:MAG TPA: hypothetical protein VEX13_11135 [Chloroflexia bacterium]|nr:hypothetical protein [Chloroflexia bacterium]
MAPTRVFSIVAWILLPTVMFGGYSLLQLMVDGNILTPFQVTYFRAGHGHAGVLLLVALLYHSYLDKTSLPDRIKWPACAAMLVSILAISGGFFIHMAIGEPNRSSVGIIITVLGALLLTLDAFLLAYGLIKSPRVERGD